MWRLEQLEEKAKLLKMLKLDKRRILKMLCEEGALKKKNTFGNSERGKFALKDSVWKLLGARRVSQNMFPTRFIHNEGVCGWERHPRRPSIGAVFLHFPCDLNSWTAGPATISYIFFFKSEQMLSLTAGNRQKTEHTRNNESQMVPCFGLWERVDR